MIARMFCAAALVIGAVSLTGCDKDAPKADHGVEQNALSDDLVRAIGFLNEREQAVIRGIYGVDEERKTMAEIGMALGLKRERVRQIRDKALRKLRKASSSD